MSPQLQLQPQHQLRIAEPSMHPLHYHTQDFLHAKATKAAKTVQFYELALRLYRDHVGHHWPPTDSSINSFLASVKQRGCKDGTVHAYYRAVRTWCNWLHRRGKIEENPIEFVDEPPRPRKLPRVPHAAHLLLLCQTLQHCAECGDWRAIRDYALIHLLHDTGLRISEATNLELTDLHVNFQAANIRRTKTHIDRTVYYPKETAEDLIRWLKTRKALPAETNHLFISHWKRYSTWGPVTPSGARQILRGWCCRAGVPMITPHQLRHAFAVHTLHAGGSLLDVRDQLGHASLATTQKYTHVLDAGRRERLAQHSPRANLAQIAEMEQTF